METLNQTLQKTRLWSISRLKEVEPIADKNAIYKEFEEWIEADDPDHEKYLRCEGVENGLALGDTYPVPPCFQDGTD